jgi:hypothetical protein
MLITALSLWSFFTTFPKAGLSGLVHRLCEIIRNRAGYGFFAMLYVTIKDGTQYAETH